MHKRLIDFSACLVILVVSAAAVFFIGWTQFKVEAGTVGILVSKTGGVSKLLKPGVFSWHWEFLLPTNAEIKTFHLKPYSYSKSVSGTLPFFENKNSAHNSAGYSYNFSFNVTVSVLPEYIFELMKESLIFSEEDLEIYIQGICDNLLSSVSTFFIEKSRSDIRFIPQSMNTEDILIAVEAYKKYPYIEFVSVCVNSAELPVYDFDDTGDNDNLVDANNKYGETELEETSFPDEVLKQENSYDLFSKIKKFFTR